MVIPWATNLLHFHLFKMVSNLALFYLATYLATFQKIGRFFPNHLVTLKADLTTAKFKIKITPFSSSWLGSRVSLEWLYQ
jgi:hypothetical protein